MRRFGCFAAVVMVSVPMGALAQRPDWELLRNRPIVDVRVESGEVFDVSRPEQDHFVFAWANALHVVTQPHVVRREFGQAIGDLFDPQRAAECERNLRERLIFQDVSVNVTPLGDGVEVVLHTVDRWSLHTNPVLRSQGGVNQIGLVLGESNLLGLGVEIGASGVYSNDVSEVALGWRDRRVLGSRWDLGFGVRNDDLGDAVWGRVGHPFFADDVPWTADVWVSSEDTERRLFESGDEVARLDIHEEQYEGFAALHDGGAVLRRLCLFHGRRHITGDVTNDVAAIGLAGAVLHRGYEYQRQIDQMGPREEFSQGFTLQLGAGMDSKALGAAHDRFLYRVEAGYARRLGDAALWGAVLRHHAFLDGGPPGDGRLLAESYGFWQFGSRAQALAWRVGGDALIDGPRSERFNLGSDDRLRGYPARELNGTRVLYGSLEQRFLSQHRLLFLRFGAVAFVDAAAAWDDSEVLDRSHARVGGGLGLRLATDPAGDNVTRIDFGVGSNSVALSFASGSFFDVTRALGFPTTRLFR